MWQYVQTVSIHADRLWCCEKTAFQRALGHLDGPLARAHELAEEKEQDLGEIGGVLGANDTSIKDCNLARDTRGSSEPHTHNVDRKLRFALT